jgi:tetratricopeptide (TPR) repeat protein
MIHESTRMGTRPLYHYEESRCCESGRRRNLFLWVRLLRLENQARNDRSLQLCLVCALWLLTAVVAFAQSPEQVFDQANQLYQQNKFAEARDAYESVVRNGFLSGELHYNLGNAYYKTGDVGKAILNYERALKFMPNDDDLKHNLLLADLMITDKIEATPRLFLWEYWDDIKGAFSLLTLTWICYGVFVLLISSICVVILARTYQLRRLGLFGGSVSSAVLILFIMLLIGKIGEVNRADAAIVTAKITTVKNSPDAKSSDAFVLHSGVRVTITDGVNEWVKIRLADGKVGWMEKNDAEVI